MENPDKVLDRPETMQNPVHSPQGNGGPRRPGNIWTPEAREDMFRRREAGEDWETICLVNHSTSALTVLSSEGFRLSIWLDLEYTVCELTVQQDYPRRSRHALQQQYSMMKKQIAVANGTWVTNRRGRKRKTSTGERWAPVNKPGQRWDEDEEDEEETEDDDFEEAEPDEPEYIEDTQAYTRRTTTIDGTPVGDDSCSKASLSSEANAAQNLRPLLPVRSATDPVPRAPKSKIVTFPNRPNPARPEPPHQFSHPKVPDALKSCTDDENSPWDPDTSTYPHKRRKYSPDSAGNAVTSIPVESGVPLTLPQIMFDEADFLEILERGRRNAYFATSNYAAEKLSEKRMFDTSISKANRRAHDAQEKLQNAYHESAEAAKAEGLLHADEIQSLKQGFEKELNLRDELYTTNIDKLQKTLERQQSERQRSDQLYQQEIAGLQRELRATKESTKRANSTEDVREHNQCDMAEIEEQAAAAKEQLRVRDEARQTFRRRIQECLLPQIISHHPKIPPQKVAYHPVSRITIEYDHLSGLLKQLSAELEDLSMKAIAKAVDNLVLVNGEFKAWLDAMVQSQKDVERALEAFDRESIASHDHTITNGNGNHDMANGVFGWPQAPG